MTPTIFMKFNMRMIYLGFIYNCFFKITSQVRSFKVPLFIYLFITITYITQTIENYKNVTIDGYIAHGNFFQSILGRSSSTFFYIYTLMVRS